MAQTGSLEELGRRGEERKDRIRLVFLRTIMIKLGILTGEKVWVGSKIIGQEKNYSYE
jgi:hypothetical protein